MASKRAELITCDMCGKATSDRDEDTVLFGQWMRRLELTVHYFCLLLSTNLPQLGGDNSGIKGFLMRDIRKEAAAAQKRICCYCGEPGASIQCHKCEKYFDLVCSMENYCTTQFCGAYYSYCKDCTPLDEYRQQLVEQPPQGLNCDICLERMAIVQPNHVVIPDCCRLGFVHKRCMRKYAATSGYYLTCIWCRSKAFRDNIRLQGIFVPDQDAEWERQKFAYRDLHVRTLLCEETECLCKYGRDYNKSSWYINACQLCGSTGAHARCLAQSMQLRRGGERIAFTCPICQEVEKKLAGNEERRQRLSITEGKEASKEEDQQSIAGKEASKEEDQQSYFVTEEAPIFSKAPMCSETPMFSEEETDSSLNASDVTVIPSQRQTRASFIAPSRASTSSLASLLPPQMEVIDLTESMEEAMDLRELQEEAMDPKESQEEAMNLTESQEEAIDPKESQEEAMDLMESQEEAIDPKESQEEAIDPKESQEEAMDLMESQEEAIDPKESQEEAMNLTESPAEAMNLTESPVKQIDPKESQKHPQHPAKSLVLHKSFSCPGEPFFYLVIYEFDERGKCKGSCTLRFDEQDARIKDRSEEALRRVQVKPEDIWFRNKDKGHFAKVDKHLDENINFK